MERDWTGNYNSIYKTLGASSHTDEEREANDYYATDPVAIDKLLTVEKPFPMIWECACGEGHLSKRLKKHGYIVVSTDLIDRGYSTAGVDFLKQRSLPPPLITCDILTNPPYKYAKEFVLKALELVKPGRKVYMFLKLQFLEGKTRYTELFSKYPPKTVYVFSDRISCIKNGEGEFNHGAVCYAWYVWEKGFSGTTEIKWI